MKFPSYRPRSSQSYRRNLARRESLERRTEAREVRRVERRGRAINQRKFEVGPSPKNWPEFMELDATPTANPKKVLLSTMTSNWQFLSVTALAFLFVYVGSALVPWALGIFLDSGIERGLTSALLPGFLLMLGMVIIRAVGAFSEPLAMVAWMRGAFVWRRDMVHKIAGARGGGRDRKPSGEIVSAVTSDTQKVGNLMFGVPSSIGAIAAFVVIVVLMLATSLRLGLIVAIGLPVIILAMSFLVKPLQKRLNAQREERGKLTTLGADAVVGLRVLRGVGGEDSYNEKYAEQSERVRDTGIHAAALQALLGGLTTAVPAVFTALIVGLGLWEVYDGNLSYGDLVAFYGYTAYLAVPVSAATQFFQMLSDARVGASRIEKILSLEPLTSDDAVVSDAPQPDWSSASLRDETSGVVVHAGKMTALVAAEPQVSSDLAERLARTDDEYTVTALWPRARTATDDTGAVASSEFESVELGALPLRTVRESIVLSDAVAQLFQGRLRSNFNAARADEPIAREVPVQMADTGDGSGIAHRDHLRSPEAASDEEISVAVDVADAQDIVLGLEEGLDGYVAERGRSLSGGQRQRVALARAVLTEAPILVLVEPTSAVDSHTESRVAAKLREQRENRTTVVVSASPIVLGTMDDVILLDNDGHEVIRGRHQDLLDDPRYYNIVHRASGGAEDEAEDEGTAK